VGVWVVRAGKCGEHEKSALRDGFVFIGWDNVGDLCRLPTWGELKTRYKDHHPEFSVGQVGHNTGQVWSFSHRIQKGDLVGNPPQNYARRCGSACD
jgi:restriction system protein